MSDEALVAAAIALLEEKPRDRIRASDIADRAGVERTLINYHFGSVELLLTFASVYHASDKIGRVFDDLAAQTLGAANWQAIQGNIKVLGLAATNEELAEIGINLLWCFEQGRFNPKVRDITVQGVRRAIDRGADFFAEICRKGWLSDVITPHTYSTFFLAAQFSLLFEYRTSGACPLSRYSSHRALFPISQRSVTLNQAAVLTDGSVPYQPTKNADDYGYVSKKTRLAEARLSAVLQAARKICEAKGGHNLQMREVAQMAHMSVGTLYRIFPNKKLLFDAIAIESVKTICANYDESLTTAEGGGQHSLEALVNATSDYFIDYAHIAPLLVQGSVAVKQYWEASLLNATKGQIVLDGASPLACASCQCYIIETLVFATCLSRYIDAPIDPREWQQLTVDCINQLNARVH